MKIYARGNLNGNTPEQYKRTARELNEVLQEVQTILQKEYAELLHGRNYQFQQDSLKKREADTALLAEMFKHHQALVDFMLATYRAGEADADDLPKEEVA